MIHIVSDLIVVTECMGRWVWDDKQEESREMGSDPCVFARLDLAACSVCNHAHLQSRYICLMYQRWKASSLLLRTPVQSLLWMSDVLSFRCCVGDRSCCAQVY